MNRGMHLSLGDTGRPEDRVMRIVNLHYEADTKDVREFLGAEFTVVDSIRGVNPKTNKNTMGYVLLATEQERIDAHVLSGRRIFGREIKVIPAQGGFRISSSGDKPLPPFKEKHPRTFGAVETCDEAPPAVGDVEAFPSLNMAATPHLPARAPTLVPIRKQPAQQRALQNQLLFMNNVGQGPEVNETSFRMYFGKYTVVDVKRPPDLRTGTSHPTAFVMLVSVEQRDEALRLLKNVPMQGRKVTLEVSKIVQNVDKQGFLPSSKESFAIFSAFPRGSVVGNAPRPSRFTDLNVREGLLAASPGIPHESSASSFTADRNANDSTICQASEGQAKNTEITWGMPCEELHQRYLGQQRTLTPMPSGIKGPGQVITGPPMTPPAVCSSPFARPAGTGTARCDPHLGIETSYRPREHGWGLGSNHDPSCHILSEEVWYGGAQALQQYKDKQKPAKATIAQRPSTERGIIGDNVVNSRRSSE